MKRKTAFFLLSMLLIFLLLSLSIYVPRAHAERGDYLFGSVDLQSSKAPPEEVCLGESLTFSILVNSDFPVPFKIVVSSSSVEVKLIPSTIRGGVQRVTVLGFFTPSESGAQFIQITTDVRNTAIDYEFKVVECEYHYQMKATYEETIDQVSFRVVVIGAGSFSAQDRVSGDGTYYVTIKPNYDETKPDLSCEVEGELKGNSDIVPYGSRSDATLDISLSLIEITMGGEPEFKCKDSEDQRAAVAFLGGLTADPTKDLPLRNLEFPLSGGTVYFPFGRVGLGSVQVWSRGEE